MTLIGEIVGDLITPLMGEIIEWAIPVVGSAPVIAGLNEGDTLSSAVTWGSYSSTTGTITSTVREMSVNGGSFVAYVAGTTVGAGDTFRLRETVTDSESNERTFFSATRTVAVIANTYVASGYVAEGYVE